MGIRKRIIRGKVAELLSQANISGAPVDPSKVAELLSLAINPQPADDDISGCLLRKEGGSVIGVNSKHSASRQRFTIAHEIGHFLFHRGESVHLDRANSFQVNFRDQDSSTGMYLEEREANFFAAELLMPREFLAAEIGVIDLSADDDVAMRNLADRFGVSMQALTFRLANLGLLTPSL